MSMIPKGTHDYEKFIKPSELRRWGIDAGLELLDHRGLEYLPFSGRCRLTDDMSVDYLMHFVVPA